MCGWVRRWVASQPAAATSVQSKARLGGVVPLHHKIPPAPAAPAAAGTTSLEPVWRYHWEQFGACTSAGAAADYFGLGLDLDQRFPLVSAALRCAVLRLGSCCALPALRIALACKWFTQCEGAGWRAVHMPGRGPLRYRREPSSSLSPLSAAPPTAPRHRQRDQWRAADHCHPGCLQCQALCGV